MSRIYPNSLSKWIDTYVGTPPSDLWTMQGPGAGIPNEIGSDDLVVGAGVVLYQQPAEDGRVAVEFTTSVTTLFIADTNFGDVGPNPVSVWARCYIPDTDTWGTNRTFMGLRASSGSLNRWYLAGRGEVEVDETLKNSFGLLVQDATNPSQSTARAMHQSLFKTPPATRWFDMIIGIDLANQRMRAVLAFVDTDRGQVIVGTERSVDDFATVDDLTGSEFGFGAHSSGAAQPDSRISYGAYWSNHYHTDAEVLELILGGKTGPVVSNFAPPLGTISRQQEIRFDVTSPFGIVKQVFVSARLVAGGCVNQEIVYDGRFGLAYGNSINRIEQITNGVRIFVRRDGGWPSAPQLRIVAVDDAGGVTEVDF